MVLGHVIGSLENTGHGRADFWATLNTVMHTFRMPMFFFLAGVFLIQTMQKRGYGPWVIDKAQYLLYPFVVWSVLTGLIEWGAFSVGVGQPIGPADIALGLIWSPRDHYWYLPALFVAFTLIGSGYFLLGRWRYWWIPVGAVTVTLCVASAQLDWWPPLVRVYGFTLFLLAGVVLAPGIVALVRRSAGTSAAVLAASVLALAAAASVALSARLLPDDFGLAFFICSVPGVLALVSLGRLLDGTRVGRGLSTLGRWSLVIYVCHAVVFSVARQALDAAGITELNTQIIVGTIIGTAGPAVLAWMMDRGHLRWLVTMPRRRAGAGRHRVLISEGRR